AQEVRIPHDERRCDRHARGTRVASLFTQAHWRTAMSAATGTELRTREGLREERTAWGIPMVLGILLVVGGLFALALNVLTSFVSVLFLGALLLVVGVLEIISAFRRRRSSPFGSYVLVGLLTLVVGAMFLWR